MGAAVDVVGRTTPGRRGLAPGSCLGRAQRAHLDAANRRLGRELPASAWSGCGCPAISRRCLPAGAAWTIEAGIELVVRVSYRKRWDRERDPASDQSTVGLYFAGAAGPDASAVTLRAGDQAGGDTRTASATISEHVRAVALWPEPASAGATVRRGDGLAGRRALARGHACAASRVGAPLLAEAPAGSSSGHAPGSQSHMAGRVTAGQAAETPLLGLDTVAAR